jgi:pyruvate,water dikinase
MKKDISGQAKLNLSWCSLVPCTGVPWWQKTKMNSVIGFFHEVDPTKSGGKGKNLTALVKAHFPVPPGFILTYDAFVEYREKRGMSGEIKKYIALYYQQLIQEAGSPWVAVRSSASAEDMQGASFAGQYDTYLYVGSDTELCQRIVACWDSLYSARANLYRERMKIPGNNLKMAVIVQTMIDPRSAGILFTTQSYQNNEHVMIVESSWGCGEVVVSGKVTPDHFVVSRQEPFQLLERLPGKKEIILQSGVETACTTAQKETDSLTPGELRQLCQIGLAIEQHFEYPQDIEWALTHDGRFYILQSRPITIRR